jgi:hypothetical protein
LPNSGAVVWKDRFPTKRRLNIQKKQDAKKIMVYLRNFFYYYTYYFKYFKKLDSIVGFGAFGKVLK